MPLPLAAIPAIIAAVGGISTNVISNISRKKRESDKRFYDMQQEHARRKYDQAMWDKVNKYNNPIEQMERLKNAGLNPNMIYGSSPGSATGNAQAISSGKQLTGQAPEYKLDNPMTPFMDTTVKQAQVNNLNTGANWNEAKALTEAQKANLTGTEARLAKDSYAWNMEIKKADAQNSYQNLIQNRLKTTAMSNKDTGIAARYATETMTAKIQQDIAEYNKHRAALGSFLAKKGIYEDSSEWIKFFGNMFPKTWDMTWDPQSLQDHRNKYEKTYR